MCRLLPSFVLGSTPDRKKTGINNLLITKKLIGPNIMSIEVMNLIRKYLNYISEEFK